MKEILVISCPATSRSGYGDHARDLIRSLIKMNRFDVKIYDQRWGDCPQNALGDEDLDISSRIITTPMVSQPDVWMQVTVPNEFQPVGKYNIGVTAGMETTTVAAEWVQGCNRMDMIIVPSVHSKNCLLGSVYDKVDRATNKVVESLKVEKPIEVLFEGLDTKLYKKDPFIPKPLFDQLQQVKENFCFLAVGHWLKGDFGHDRKDMGSLIRNFIDTFKNKIFNRPALILKISAATFSVVDREDMKKRIDTIIRQSGVKNPPSVYLLHGDLTKQEMAGLYNFNKIKAMVSFTHGEGFGRPLLEFSNTGKPTIAPNWSGHLDFLSKYGILLGGELRDVHESAQWENVIIKGSKWFYVDQGYASAVLKEIFVNYNNHENKTRKQTQYIKENFSLEIMDKKFKEYMDRIPKREKLNLNLPKLEISNA